MTNIRLIQDAYVCGYDGAFYRFTTAEGKPSATGIFDNWYAASAEDENGNKYSVVWAISDKDAFDSGDEDCCDWDNPAEILDEQGNDVTDKCTIVW